MKKARFGFIAAGVLFLLFVLFTVLVANVDLQPIGPESSVVGLATLNGAVAEAIGVHMVWYQITDILGYLAILVALFFGLLGVLQLIKGRSLARVDSDILALGGFYVLVVVFYVIFELVCVNYRPVIIDPSEGLEASYPSSHTMLALCVFTTAIFQFQSRIRDRQVCKVIEIVAVILIVLTVGGRLISGVHWFTDIIGSLLLSSSLIVLYCATVIALKTAKKKNK